MSAHDDIVQRALALSAEDRAYIVTALQQSWAPEEEAAEEFLKELRRRSAAYRAGTTTAKSIDEVLSDLWRRQDK